MKEQNLSEILDEIDERVTELLVPEALSLRDINKKIKGMERGEKKECNGTVDL